MKGLFIPEVTAEMFRNGCLESIEALMAEGEIYDIEYSPWIPVSKRMPEFGKNVLTQGEDGYMRVDWYSSDNIWFWAEDDAYQPIAWMPLPKPYEPQGKER